MSQNIINLLSSDDDDPCVDQTENDIGGKVSTTSPQYWKCAKNPRALPSLVRSPHKENGRRRFTAKTFSYLKRYRDNGDTSLMPTIVNVQSLAKPLEQHLQISSTYTISSPLAPAAQKKKSSALVTSTGVIRKQIYKNPDSSIESIVASIESCVRKYSDPPVIKIDCSPPQSPGTQIGDIPSGHRPTSHHANASEVNGRSSPVEIAEYSVVEIAKMGANRKTHLSEDPSSSSSSHKNSSSNSNENKTRSNALEASPNTLFFRKFLCQCARLEDDAKDRIRAGEKLRGYHDKAATDYVESKEFEDLLQAQFNRLDKERLYLCISDVLDELKNHKKNRATLLSAPSTAKVGEAFNKTQPDPLNPNSEESLNLSGPLSVGDEQIVKKLTRTMHILSRKIKRFEEAEVDLDDEEDSTYFRMQRYRERFAKVHSKLCEYTGSSWHAGRVTKKKIRFNGTQYPEANKLIERWLNKTGSFPDYADVLRMFKSLDLGLRPIHLQTIAQKTFLEIGDQLQKRRRLDLWDSLGSFAGQGEDPAAHDSALQATLHENDTIYRKKEQEIIDSFVQKQMEVKGDPKSNEAAEKGSSDGEGDVEKESSGADSSCDSDDSQNETKNNYKNCKSKWSKPDSEVSIEEREVTNPESTSLVEDEKEMGDVLSVSTQDTDSVSMVCDDDDDTMAAEVIAVTVGSPTQRVIGTKHGGTGTQNRVFVRKTPASRPFGTAGKVVEINYFTVENCDKENVLAARFSKKSSVLKDCQNLLGSKTPFRLREVVKDTYKGLPCDFKASIAHLLYASAKYSPDDARPLQTQKCLYKCHGTVANGGSPSDGLSGSGTKDNAPSSDNPPQESHSSHGAGGGNGNGDQDQEEDKNKPKTDKGNDDDEEDAEDAENDCEQEKTECEEEQDGENSEGNATHDSGRQSEEPAGSNSPTQEENGNYNEECNPAGLSPEETQNEERNYAEMSPEKTQHEENKEPQSSPRETQKEENEADLSAGEAQNELSNHAELSSEEAQETSEESDILDARSVPENNDDSFALHGDGNPLEADGGDGEDDNEKSGDSSGEATADELEADTGNEEDRLEKSEQPVEENEMEDELEQLSGDELDPSAHVAVVVAVGDAAADDDSLGNKEEKDDDDETKSAGHKKEDDKGENELNNEKDHPTEDSCESETGPKSDPLSQFEKSTSEIATEKEVDQVINSDSILTIEVKKEIEDSDSKSGDGNPSAYDSLSIPPPRTDLTLDMENFFSTEEEKPEDKESPKKPAWIDNGEESENESNGAESRVVDSTQSNDASEEVIKPNDADSRINETLDAVVKAALEESDKPKLPVAKRKNNIPLKSEPPRKKPFGTIKTNDIEVISETIVHKPPTVSPDERIKRFLQSADRSLQITVTRKRPLSDEAKQALEQLKRLKNISATRVARTEPDVMVIDERQRPGPSRAPPRVAPRTPSALARTVVPSPRTLMQRTATPMRTSGSPNMHPAFINALQRGRPIPRGQFPRPPQFRLNGLPVISSVQSFSPRTPMITGVRGSMARPSPLARVRGGQITPLRRPPGPPIPAPSPQGRGISRGRGPVRGKPRAVPFVVLD